MPSFTFVPLRWGFIISFSIAVLVVSALSLTLWPQNCDPSWNQFPLPWLNLSVTPCPQNCSWIGCHSGCIEDDASKGGGDVTTTRSFYLFHLILSYLPLLSYLVVLHLISLSHVTPLSKDWVMWYDVTGTLVPIKGPGFHRIPGHSMGFYFLPCDVTPLHLFGHFSIVYIGLLYRVCNPRIDLV